LFEFDRVRRSTGDTSVRGGETRGGRG